MKSRILITGGREFIDREFVFKTLTECSSFFDPEFVLIHGNARGVDHFAHLWSFFKGNPVIQMPANWDHYGKRAGGIRNSWMLKYTCPDLLIAFPGGTGTRDMINKAKAAKVDVYEVPYNA